MISMPRPTREVVPERHVRSYADNPHLAVEDTARERDTVTIRDNPQLGPALETLDDVKLGEHRYVAAARQLATPAASAAVTRRSSKPCPRSR
jgi:hypothetical protein